MLYGYKCVQINGTLELIPHSIVMVVTMKNVTGSTYIAIFFKANLSPGLVIVLKFHEDIGF